MVLAVLQACMNTQIIGPKHLTAPHPTLVRTALATLRLISSCQAEKGKPCTVSSGGFACRVWGLGFRVLGLGDWVGVDGEKRSRALATVSQTSGMLGFGPGFHWTC